MISTGDCRCGNLRMGARAVSFDLARASRCLPLGRAKFRQRETNGLRTAMRAVSRAMAGAPLRFLLERTKVHKCAMARTWRPTVHTFSFAELAVKVPPSAIGRNLFRSRQRRICKRRKGIHTMLVGCTAGCPFRGSRESMDAETCDLVHCRCWLIIRERLADSGSYYNTVNEDSESNRIKSKSEFVPCFFMRAC